MTDLGRGIDRHPYYVPIRTQLEHKRQVRLMALRISPVLIVMAIFAWRFA